MTDDTYSPTGEPENQPTPPLPRPPYTPIGKRKLRAAPLNHTISTFRLLRAYFYDVLTLLKEARTPLLGFVVLTIINTTYLTLFYDHPSCEAYPVGNPQACMTIPRAIFETMRMYVFEINIEWPNDNLFGQALFFITPILGVALLFQSVLDFSRHLLDKGSRQEAWQISLAHTYHNHIILCGLGRVSYRIMTLLISTGYEVVVIEQDWSSKFVSEALKLRVPVIHGSATDPDVLIQAGLFNARGLIAGTSDDLINIEVALTTRRLHDSIHVVMRIFNDELDTNLEQSFGPNTAFSSSALGAPTMAVAAVSCSIAYALPLADTVLGVSEVTIAPDSQLAGFGNTIEETYQVRFLQWLGSDGQWHQPEPGLRLAGDDVVLLLGTIEALERVAIDNRPGSKFDFLRPERLPHPTPPINTVIVCGLGRVGYRMIKALQQRIPRIEIVVICTEETKPLLITEIQAPGVHIIRGDARIADVLLEAGITHAYSLAAVTSNNLTNIQIGLTARRLRPDVDVVLRVFSAVLAEQLDTIFGMYTAFSTSALAAPTLAAAALESGISYAINIGDRLLSTVEISVHTGDEFVGNTIEQVYACTKVVIVALHRGEERMIMPNKALVLQVGDEIEILADIQTISHLKPRIKQHHKRITRKLAAVG
jgi:Trk K+ transport system NAD-binding subunit